MSTRTSPGTLPGAPIASVLAVVLAVVLTIGSGVVCDGAHAAIVPKESPERFELIFWDSIKDSDNPGDYEAYLEAYPDGKFAPLARARAKRLREQLSQERRADTGPPVEDMDAEYRVLKNARLRAEPDASSDNLGTLEGGSRVIVTGKVIDSDWYRIETMDGKSGFVFGSLIEEARRGADQAAAEKEAADKEAEEKAAEAAAAEAAAREAEEKARQAEAEQRAAEKAAAEEAERRKAEKIAEEKAAEEEAARKAAAEEAARKAAAEAAAAEKARQEAAEAAAEAAAAEAARRAAAAKVAGTKPAEVKTFRDCESCPEMIALKPGSFVMGSRKGDVSEQPAHEVRIDYPFAIGRFEVTVAEWKVCHADGGCKYLPERKGMTATSPVYNVSWVDAQQYVKWLSEKTGKEYRLPTEAEWEYAARAGTDSRFWWGDEVGSGNANCKNCGGEWNNKWPAAVDTFDANDFGLHGTSGSVWEWVADCWYDNYKDAPTDGSARTRNPCFSRVLRGGSWRNDASYARSASRFTYDNDVRYVLNGFRVARAMNQ